MSELLKNAIPEVGVKEISGSGHNRRIIDYAQESGFEWVNDDETPWCSIFLNWCAKQAGLKRSKMANARSWLLIGDKVLDPEPGDVVVFWRTSPQSWQGHVGIFMGFSYDLERIYCLGGNQGNQVSITAYSQEKFLGFRRLLPARNIKLHKRRLKLGSTGEAVRLLQEALKILGFNCGTSDGIFGPLTESCVMDVQASSGTIGVDGIVDKKTREYIEKAVNA